MKRKNLLCGACLAAILTVCPVLAIHGAQTHSEIQDIPNMQEAFPLEMQENSQTKTMTEGPSQEIPSDEIAEEERTAPQQVPQVETPLPEESQQENQQEESETLPSPTYEEKWIKNSTGWWYQNEDGSYLASQWQKINGVWYYFLPSGYMATGWQFVNGNWYYLQSSGAMVTGWQLINGSWYYMNASGTMTTGWQSIRNSWYYMNASGVMQADWQFINGSWYYMNNSGAMQTGWQRIHGVWYHMDSSGAMQTGWQFIDGSWYYMDNSGAMRTGWLELSNTWYYLNASGAMQTGWLKTGSQWYYFTESGNIVSSSWREINDKWYYFHSDGSMAANTWIGNCYVNNSGEWVEDIETSDYIWPCPGYTTITSDYGYRGAPTAGASTYHKGIDIGAPHGSKIVSVCNGRVLAYGYNSSMGNYVKIQHADQVVSVYMHMSKIADISTGQTVSAGTVLGYVGSTGVSTGPHLHLGIMLNNDYVSPWNYLKRPN